MPAVSQAFAVIEEIHHLMSFHDPQSDVSRLNYYAYQQPVKVNPKTWHVLSCAQTISELSEGIFDITIAPLLIKSHLLPKIDSIFPTIFQHGIPDAIELLTHHFVRFLQPIAIDLGGIAKGYAVDQAAEVLQNHGVSDYVVNAGGDLRVGMSAEIIYLRHPQAPYQLLPLAKLRNAAMATSARYFFYTRQGSRIVHPAKEALAKLKGSISVFADECIVADALTKVAGILKQDAIPILKQFGAEACWFDKPIANYQLMHS